PLLLERGLEVILDRVAGLLADAFPLLEGRGLGPDRVVAPLQELRQIRVRETGQREEEGRWQRRREVFVEVTLAVVDERVDRLVHELAHLVLELRHLPRRELRVEKAAVL